MTSPPRSNEPDSPPAPPSITPEGDGYTYIGPMSYADYRRYAELSEFALEYVDGVVYAKSTGTVAHAVIVGNTFARLRTLVRGTGCRAYGATLTVRTPRAREYVPDGVVDCGPRGPDDAHLTGTPCLIVEVLSPSTARVDLIEKRIDFQEIPTLDAYLVVEAEWRGVHRFWRDEGGAWRAEDVAGDGDIPLPCPPGAVLTLAEIYEDLDLPGAPPTPPVPKLRRVREEAVV